MKIQNKKFFNTSVNFSNTEVKFDKEGVASVSAELGMSIMANFPNEFWEEGKEPVPVKPANAEPDSKEVANLKSDVARLNGIVAQKNQELKAAKEEADIWKAESEKLINHLKTLVPEGTKLGIDSSDENVGNSNGGEALIELKKTIATMKVDELKAFAKESGIEGDVDNMTKKEITALLLDKAK
jgi:hypothetical protein